jgi:E3 SUMO-protein ligase PIAS1
MLRVATPTRSVKCVHPSCFDATTWFTMMENTTTWQCPICDKVLDPDELFVDGFVCSHSTLFRMADWERRYFESIINATPEDCDDVMVEADGEWHTADNKYASSAWKAAHPPQIETQQLKKRSPSPAAAKAPSAAVYVLEDSDDEDEGQVKRELSPSFRGFANGSFNRSFATLPPSSQTPAPPSRQASKVIDLTLDSDDDEPASTPAPSRPAPVTASAPAPPVTPSPRTLPLQMDPPLPLRTHMSPNDSLSSHQRPDKRKASSDDRDGADGAWKRSRPADGTSSSYTNGRSIPPPPHRPAYDPYPSTNRQDADLYHSSPPSHTRPTYPSSTSSQQANGSNYRYGY